MNDQGNKNELAAAYRDAAESANEIHREFAHVSDEAWDSLGLSPGVEGYDAGETTDK